MVKCENLQPFSVRIQAPSLFVDRTGLRPAFLPRSGLSRSAFSDRASLVPRVMFSAGPQKEWTLSGLAEEAGISISGASYAMHDLRERGVVEIRRSGREKRVRLVSRISLVEEWVREYHWRDNPSVGVLAPVGSPERFLKRIGASLRGLPWAVTLHAGAALFARHAPVEDIHIYLEARTAAELLEIARQAGWEIGEEGPVRLLSPRYSKSLWQGVTQVGDVPVVSKLQLVLDLWNHPVRGREQAERLLETLEKGSDDGR